MTLYLHLGAHKTATTYLQNVLAHNEMALAQRGLLRLKIRARHLFWHLYRDGDHKAYVRRRRSLGHKIKRFAEAGGHGVFSSETMFGTSDLEGVDCLYPHAMRVMKTLAALTEGMDRKVVFYIRRQDDFIESTFINRIQTLATSIHLDYSTLLADQSWSSFDAYLDSFDPSCLSWLHLIQRMEAVFGKENLIIHPFETILRSRTEYARTFLAPMVETEGLDLAPDVYANRSFSAPALKEFLRLAPLQEYGNLKSLRRRLQAEYPNTDYPRPRLLDNQQRQSIMRLHTQSNSKIFSDYIQEGEQKFDYSK